MLGCSGCKFGEVCNFRIEKSTGNIINNSGETAEVASLISGTHLNNEIVLITKKD